MEYKPDNLLASSIITAYETALSKREEWDSVWEDCYKFAHPKFIAGQSVLKKQVFDATAPDAVDELAGVISGELSPRSAQWARIVPTGHSQTEQEVCDMATKSLSDSINASNFAVEMHQCIVDLVVAGTAVMLVEPSDIISQSPLKFTALDLKSIVLEDSGTGLLDTIYRTQKYNRDALIQLYPMAESLITDQQEKSFSVIELIKPKDGKYMHTVILKSGVNVATVLKETEYNTPPFIAFRWQKATGEVYGCSPIMKALPDIKTANKVVELTLKNAAISVTGIWQADDDGVLNPSTVRLVPGTIIPKAVGSSGLQPLKSPGDFNMSNMVLEKLQQRIRRALLADVFSSTIARTATEVHENSMRSRQVLNAVYERIVQECYNPLLNRIYGILFQKGMLPNIDELGLKLDIHSPIERLADARKIIMVKNFFESARAYSENLSEAIDITEAIKWLAKESGVPQEFIINKEDMDTQILEAFKQDMPNLGADLSGGKTSMDIA